MKEILVAVFVKVEVVVVAIIVVVIAASLLLFVPVTLWYAVGGWTPNRLAGNRLSRLAENVRSLDDTPTILKGSPFDHSIDPPSR